MIKFKNISSTSMNVVIEEVENLLARAPIRVETFDIEGRHGVMTETLGYGAVDISLQMYLLNKSKMDDVKSWLQGLGELEYEDRVTKVHIDNEIKFVRTSGIHIFDVELSRYPFWYKKDDSYVTVTNNIINEGNIDSLPFIKLTKTTSNKVTITINDVQFDYDFKNDDHVIIDCEEKHASFDNLSRNRQLTIGFKFPKIKPGDNKLLLNSGACKIEVKRKDCWL